MGVERTGRLCYRPAMPKETVLVDIDAGVAVVTWNRPRQRNAFSQQMWLEGRDTLRELLEDRGVRAVVVTGAGEAFSAGQDLGEMTTAPADGGEHGFPGFMNALCSFDKPLIAAVNGVGVGIGLTMLLHCDVVYVSEAARLRAPFIPLGVVPEAASSYMLPLIVGYQAAAEILYTADWIDARRAVELGIASRMYAPAELLPAARAFAAKIAAGPIGAIRHTKRLVLATRADQIRAAREREDRAFEERIGTPENLEAISAFFAKRPPDFSKID